MGIGVVECTAWLKRFTHLEGKGFVGTMTITVEKIGQRDHKLGKRILRGKMNRFGDEQKKRKERLRKETLKHFWLNFKDE